MLLSREKLQLCDIQGRLFELALKNGCDCPKFIEAFMNSKTASFLDDIYDRMQWAGEEYILEELNDEVNGLKKAGTSFNSEIMYWIGYTYRYWHYYTGESSRQIYRTANGQIMNDCWLGFRTLDIELAIDNLKEIYVQTHNS